MGQVLDDLLRVLGLASARFTSENKGEKQYGHIRGTKV